MIGGTDFLFDNFALGAGEALDLVARIASRQWDDAVFVDAHSGRRFESFAHAELGSLSELFVFRDEVARAGWERDGFDPAHADAMIYAIARDDQLTVVLADPSSVVLQAMLAELRDALAYGTPHSSWRLPHSGA